MSDGHARLAPLSWPHGARALRTSTQRSAPQMIATNATAACQAACAAASSRPEAPTGPPSSTRSTQQPGPLPQREYPGSVLAAMTSTYPTTPDGRYFVVRGRLWRCSNPALPPARRAELTRALMAARRDKGAAMRAGDAGAREAARMQPRWRWESAERPGGPTARRISRGRWRSVRPMRIGGVAWGRQGRIVTDLGLVEYWLMIPSHAGHQHSSPPGQTLRRGQRSRTVATGVPLGSRPAFGNGVSRHSRRCPWLRR